MAGVAIECDDANRVLLNNGLYKRGRSLSPGGFGRNGGQGEVPARCVEVLQNLNHRGGLNSAVSMGTNDRYLEFLRIIVDRLRSRVAYSAFANLRVGLLHRDAAVFDRSVMNVRQE